MAELIDIANAMFKNKKDWVNISEDDKEKFFFIMNRYFSKKFPDKSQLLNLKNINKATALDLWYYFMLDKPFPKWFWSKSTLKSEKPEIIEKDFNLLQRKLNLKKEDLEYLINNYFEIVKEELKYYKELEKQH
jgi:hypothetical protein